MSELSAAQGFGSVEELFQQHTRPLLLSYGDSYTVWGNHSPERQIFDTLLLEAGRCLLLSVACGLCAHLSWSLCTVRSKTAQGRTLGYIPARVQSGTARSSFICKVCVLDWLFFGFLFFAVFLSVLTSVALLPHHCLSQPPYLRPHPRLIPYHSPAPRGRHRLTYWLIDWSTDWLADCLSVWLLFVILILAVACLDCGCSLFLR